MSESEHPAGIAIASADLISVCITSYRRPSLLLHAVLSCLNQDYRPLEIDVSDDSPNGAVQEAIALLSPPEGVTLRYRHNTPALGEAQNINSLFKEARGRRLILLHDDDILLPGAVSALAQAFHWDERVIASFGLQEIMSHNGEAFHDKTVAFNATFHRRSDTEAVLEDPLLSALQRQFPNNGYLLLSEAAREVGQRTIAEIGRAGDTDFGIRLAAAHPQACFAFVATTTARCRLTNGSSSTQPGICWKLYEQLAQMKQLSTPQAEARDKLMRELQVQALIDNAVHGNRRKALRIFLSRAYRAETSLPRASYHLALIAASGVQRLRSKLRLLQG